AFALDDGDVLCPRARSVPVRVRFRVVVDVGAVFPLDEDHVFGTSQGSRVFLVVRLVGGRLGFGGVGGRGLFRRGLRVLIRLAGVVSCFGSGGRCRRARSENRTEEEGRKDRRHVTRHGGDLPNIFGKWKLLALPSDDPELARPISLLGTFNALPV